MFPMTITVHTAAQLNAVLAAMRPELTATDFAHPAVGAAYVEASARVDAHEKAAVLGQAQPAGEAAAPSPKSSPAPRAPGPRTAAAEGAAAPEKTADASAPTAAPAEVQPPASTAAADPAAPVTYGQVAAAMTAAVKIDRAKVLAALAKFGAKKGPDLKPEQYADFLVELL